MREDIDKYLVNFADIPYERISIERVLTGFKDLDYFNKGIEVGVTEVVGDTNTGKSIFTSSLINSAITQGYRVGVFAGEHTLEKYKMQLMQQNATKKDFEIVPFIDKNGHETNIADWYVNQACENKINIKYANKLYLYNVDLLDRDIDTLSDFIEYAYTNKNIRFFIIDNLMEIDNNSQNQFQEQTQIVTRLRNLAIKHKLFLILVMHTNKSSGTDGFRLTIKNAFGSSNITNKGYNVWFLYRRDSITNFNRNESVLNKFIQDCAKDGFDFEACDGFIETAKTKGNCNGITGLIYDKDTKTFKQAEKISKTDADRIYKKHENKQQTNLDWDNKETALVPTEEDISDIFD